MNKSENKLLQIFNKYEYYLYAFIFLAFAFVLRILWIDFASQDYQFCLDKWFSEIKNCGGIKGFSSTIGDYTVMYKYLITIMTYLPLPPIVSFKLFSSIFDIILAVYIALCIYEIKKDKQLALAGFAIILFLPNVWLNSSVWAQCDSIFTCFTVISFYYLLKHDSKKVFIFYAISFSFKLQAIFFAPVLIICLLKGNLKFKDIWCFPLTYFLCALPAILMGMNILHALFGAYLIQVYEYPSFYLNAPNIYTIFPPFFRKINLIKQFIIMAVGFMGVTGFLLWKKSKKTVSHEFLVFIAYFFTLLAPFILPEMHERYFYMSDIFAVLFGFVFYKKIYIPILTISASLCSIIYVLFELTSINIQTCGSIMFAGVILLSTFLIKFIEDENKSIS